MKGTAVAVAAALTLVGCGGEPQDKNEKAGTYNLEVTKASWPSTQSIAQQSKLVIAVRNADTKPVPNVAVTIHGDPKSPSSAFAANEQATGLADAARPLWIVDDGPRGGSTAFVNTWALGPLKPGQTKTFVWKLTAVQAGVHTVSYRVAAGLDGKAKAKIVGGGSPESSFTVRVASAPPQSEVGPGGEVIKKPAP